MYPGLLGWRPWVIPLACQLFFPRLYVCKQFICPSLSLQTIFLRIFHPPLQKNNGPSLTSNCQIKYGKPRSMSPEQELFLVLIRLRLGLLVQDIAHCFRISTIQVSRIFKTWIVFLYQRLHALPIWPSRNFVDDNMPGCFN
jgi:hypothetical protein